MRPCDRIRGLNQRLTEDPPLRETNVTPTMAVCAALVGAILTVAAGITLERPALAPPPPPLPEQIRGTSDLWQGTPMQAILLRWPPEQMPAWAVDTFDPAPGPVSIPLLRPRPPETSR